MKLANKLHKLSWTSKLGSESAEHLGRSPPKEATDSRDGGGRKADHQDHSDGFAEQLLAAGPDHEFQLINRVRQKTTGFGGIGSGF